MAGEAQSPAVTVGFEDAVHVLTSLTVLIASSSSCLRFALVHLIEVVLEGIEARHPESAIWRQPVVDLAKRVGLQPVHPSLGIDPHLDEPGVAQHPEMLRHRRLTHRQPGHQISDRALPGTEEVEDPAAIRLGQHLESSRHGAQYAYSVI